MAIVVHSIDSSLPYYRDTLGLVVTHDEYVEGAGVRLVHLAGSDKAATCTLQLVEPNSDGPVRTHLDSRGEGLHHVCLAVPDLGAFVRSVSGGSDGVFFGGRGKPACFLRGQPNGVLIEILECMLEPSEA